MKKGLLAMLVALACATTCAFALPACDNDEPGDNGGAQTVAIESVTLDKNELTLNVGDEEMLTATVSPDDATDKTVTWSSDNTAVATVANGKVTAVSAGTATITAKAGGKSATCTVTVNSALTEDTDFDALVSDKVTEDGWKAAFSDNAFENVTIKFSSSGDFPGTATLFKYGTTMCITMKMESGEETPSIPSIPSVYIFEKDGEKYGYVYNEVSGWLDTGWFTDESVSDDLLNIVSSYRCILPDFGENFDSFTYDSANGAYILKDTIIQNYLPIFFDSTGDYYDYSNISIKIKENQLACFKAVVNVAEFTLEFEHHIYNYGTTEALTIPSEIEDMLDTAKVNGKTFVFSDMTSEDIDAATLEEQIAMSKDTKIVFGGTDTFTITSSMLGLSVVQKGTFSQSGEEIELTITETTVGGQPVEGTTSSKATFDGEKLYITVVTPAGTVTSIYVLTKN